MALLGALQVAVGPQGLVKLNRAQLVPGRLHHEIHQTGDGRTVGPSTQGEHKATRSDFCAYSPTGPGAAPGRILPLSSWGRSPNRRAEGFPIPAVGEGRQTTVLLRADLRSGSWLEAEEAGLIHAVLLDIQRGRRDQPGPEPETRPAGHQLTTGSDDSAAIVNGPAGLIAQQVGVDIATPSGEPSSTKRSRTFCL